MNEKTEYSLPTDCWCGWKLTPSEQIALIAVTLCEFEKPMKHRKLPEQLVRMVVGNDFRTIKLKYEKDQRKLKRQKRE